MHLHCGPIDSFCPLILVLCFPEGGCRPGPQELRHTPLRRGHSFFGGVGSGSVGMCRVGQGKAWCSGIFLGMFGLITGMRPEDFIVDLHNTTAATGVALLMAPDDELLAILGPKPQTLSPKP